MPSSSPQDDTLQEYGEEVAQVLDNMETLCEERDPSSTLKGKIMPLTILPLPLVPTMLKLCHFLTICKVTGN